MKPTSAVYWMRFFLAIVAGFTEQVLHINVLTLGDMSQIVGIGIGILFYIISVFIVRYVFRYDEVALKGKNRDKTFGIGTYFMTWLVITILLNTVTSGR